MHSIRHRLHVCLIVILKLISEGNGFDAVPNVERQCDLQGDKLIDGSIGSTSLLQSASHRINVTLGEEAVISSNASLSGLRLPSNVNVGTVLLILAVVLLSLAIAFLAVVMLCGLKKVTSYITWSEDHSAQAAPETGEVNPDIPVDEEDDKDDDNDPIGQLYESIGIGSVWQERIDYSPTEIPDYISNQYSSWKLLTQILTVVLEFWTALALMYWSLIKNEDEFMKCGEYPKDQQLRDSWESVFVRHSCYYTLACLRGFPILAANVVLVMMVRILVQSRMFYTMMREGYILDFAAEAVLYTVWPWMCGFSMLQGGLHFALKAHFTDHESTWGVYMKLVRKFVLPGMIFFHILLRYVDIENSLVPLSRLIELDYTKENKHCPWLARIKALNERVLAYDARHRDVIHDTAMLLKRAPTIDDVMRNMIDNYDSAHQQWENYFRHHFGLFKSMWAASVLVDRRLDRDDPETRSWLKVFGIMTSGCVLTSLLSFYWLFKCTDSLPSLFHLRHIMADGLRSAETEVLLGNFVVVFHAIMIVVFIHRAVRSMFYFSAHSSQSAHIRRTLSRRLA